MQELMNKLDAFPESDPMEIYIAQKEGNCYYSMAQLLLNVSFVESFPGSDLKEKFENLYSEILDVSRLFLRLYHNLIIVITKRHLDFDSETVEIPDPPSFSEIHVPYFTTR